jgi:hypothetical protein
VSGTVTAGNLRSNNTLEVGVYPPASETVAVDGTIGATGNISTAAALRGNSLAPVSGSVVTASNDLTIVGVTRCDVLQGRVASQVTCQDNLTVQGVLKCQNTQIDTISELTPLAGVTCNSHFTISGGRLPVDGFQSPNGHLVVPGNITLSGDINGWSPFWVAGMVDGNANVLVSKGKVAFTCTREATGNFRITFASPHPNGAIYVATLLSASPCPNFWVDQVAASSFLAVVRTSSFGNQNATFSFMVLA